MKGDVILLKNFKYRIRSIVEDACSRNILENALCIAMADRDLELKDLKNQEVKNNDSFDSDVTATSINDIRESFVLEKV
jgi:hypothetical protein